MFEISVGLVDEVGSLNVLIVERKNLGLILMLCSEDVENEGGRVLLLHLSRGMMQRISRLHLLL